MKLTTPLSCANVKNTWTCPFTSPSTIMACTETALLWHLCMLILRAICSWNACDITRQTPPVRWAAVILPCCCIFTCISHFIILTAKEVLISRLRWSRGSVPPLSTQVRGFKPGQSRKDFSERKNPQHAFLQKGCKAVGPMLQICGM